MRVSPYLVATNLCLLVLYPIAWLAPLARAAFLPFFSGDKITIFGGVHDLWETDIVLAFLVGLFAVAIPYAKTLVLVAVHFGRLGPRAVPIIEVIGKLSMADVFLIAVYIVMVKGVGIGTVTPAWGLWLFTACVLVQIGVAHLTSRHLKGGPQ